MQNETKRKNQYENLIKSHLTVMAILSSIQNCFVSLYMCVTIAFCWIDPIRERMRHSHWRIPKQKANTHELLKKLSVVLYILTDYTDRTFTIIIVIIIVAVTHTPEERKYRMRKCSAIRIHSQIICVQLFWKYWKIHIYTEYARSRT